MLGAQDGQQVAGQRRDGVGAVGLVEPVEQGPAVDDEVDVAGAGRREASGEGPGAGSGDGPGEGSGEASSEASGEIAVTALRQGGWGEFFFSSRRRHTKVW